LDRVTLADELATGCRHPVLGQRRPTCDEPWVLGVTRRTGAKCTKKIGELALVEPEIGEEIRSGGRRMTHGSTVFSPLLGRGASHAKEEEVGLQRSWASEHRSCRDTSRLGPGNHG
jgi:hypothetical protein